MKDCNCRGCKLVCKLKNDANFKNKELILDDAHFFAFRSDDPVIKEHTVIMQKKHVEKKMKTRDITDLSKKELSCFGIFIKKACEKLKKRNKKIRKFYICSFNETAGMHFHVNLIPSIDSALPFKKKYAPWGNKGPGLYFMLSTFKDWKKLKAD